MFLIQPANNVFTRHFIYDLRAIDKPAAITAGSLFDNFHAHRKEISGYLFQASNINQEIIDFIQAFKSNTKIYLYFDKFNQQLYNDASTMIRCIVKDDPSDKSIVLKTKNTIKANPMYSEQLISVVDTQEDRISNEDILADISDLQKLPESLVEVLYPSTSMRIKLFNNASIDHVQNLGFVDDEDMVRMINECKMYIDTNNNFLLYSIILDKPTLALTANSLVKRTKEINEKSIESMQQSKIDLRDILKNSYKNFIQKYLL